MANRFLSGFGCDSPNIVREHTFQAQAPVIEVRIQLLGRRIHIGEREVGSGSPRFLRKLLLDHVPGFASEDRQDEWLGDRFGSIKSC